jgi:DUF4097 and DUF4098 domain-containing protein YvlB
MADATVVHITTRTGKVRVEATETSEISVDGGTIERRDDGTLHITRASWSGSIDVRCAPGTDVTVGTVSGSVDLVGSLGAVRVATVSGRIRVEEASRIDLRTKSGKVDIGTCTGVCRVMTKSSAVHVRHADQATIAGVSGVVLLERVRGAEIKTVSGKVLIGSDGGDRLAVHTVSGKVEIRVPAATRPSTRLRSLSGRIDCDLTPGDEYEIAVMSVSGAIRVSSA